ncbi:Hok/Gef family protein [Escherichia coli]|nr:Hok/Gef family protein [Escherichia coli]
MKHNPLVVCLLIICITILTFTLLTRQTLYEVAEVVNKNWPPR